MGAWRKAGVWLGLVEDDDDRDGVYDDEYDDDFRPARASTRDDFAVPARPRSLVRPQRGVDHDRLERDRLERDRLERDRDRLERVRRDRTDPRVADYDEGPSGREARGGFDPDRGRSDPYGADRARVEREAPAVRQLRTERATEPAGDFAEPRLSEPPAPPTPRAPRPAPATVRPLLRPTASPTAGSTALSLPAEEDLTIAPQVQLRERAAATAERTGRRYEITTLHPTSYSEARAIGEQFRDGHPVIMNLTEMDEPDAKRLVDFAAGLAFGLRGSMERVTNRVFLLTPPNIRVSDEDKQRIAETGYSE